jgi:superoxide dismutase, Fe-Mn family
LFKLPELPYAYDALEPTVSAETMHLHHDKHHAKYVETMNGLCEKEGLTPASLEELVQQAKSSGKSKLFNNAAQAWNHAFFWSCMTPDQAGPEEDLRQMIDQAFGGMDQLKAKFVEEGANHFGSGWVWLLASGKGLEVRSTHDGANLVGEQGVTPLLVCDLWEHAYYVDYRNDRKDYLEKWFDALPDWSFAGHQLKAAKGQGDAWRYPAPEGQPARRQA